jgi:ZIP family zinc transporter
MPLALEAAMWGAVGGSALVIGAAIGYYVSLPVRAIAGIMAFGAGVLISALSFELMVEALSIGGFGGTAIGFLLGAAAFTAANAVLSRYGARHRKRSGLSGDEGERMQADSGLSIAIGSMFDNIPESVAIGLSLVGGEKVSIVTVIAVFVSNIPEALSAAVGLRNSGRSAQAVVGLFAATVPICALSALLGYAVIAAWDESAIAMVIAIAAGAILAMLADTMIPEAFEQAHDYAGLVIAVGYLLSFALSNVL